MFCFYCFAFSMQFWFISSLMLIWIIMWSIFPKRCICSLCNKYGWCKHIPQIPWGVITCPSPWYLLLAHISSFNTSYGMWCVVIDVCQCANDILLSTINYAVFLPDLGWLVYRRVGPALCKVEYIAEGALDCLIKYVRYPLWIGYTDHA